MRQGAWWDGPVARLATWSQYRGSIGDRSGLFAALADSVPIQRALYPGSYVDLSPSTSIRSVAYVDTDARAARFFADADLVRAPKRRTPTGFARPAEASPTPVPPSPSCSRAPDQPDRRAELPRRVLRCRHGS